MSALGRKRTLAQFPEALLLRPSGTLLRLLSFPDTLAQFPCFSIQGIRRGNVRKQLFSAVR